MPVHSLTPYRQVEIESPEVEGLYIDVTRQLGSSQVLLIEETSGIDQLTFTIRHGATYWIEHVVEGMPVRLTAGYAADVLLRTTRRMMFEGVVARYEPILPDNGKPELRVVCQNRLYELTKNKPGRISYPAIKIDNFPPAYTRDFHFGKALKISDIVRGILGEYNIPVQQLVIESEHDYEFSLANPISQNEDETDFDFIMRLLSGRSAKTRRRVRNKKVNHLVNARAVLFMEVDQVTKQAMAHIVPEAEVLSDKGDVTFVYQSPGALSVDEYNYDPLDSEAALVIRGVQIRENREEARGKEVQHRKDVKKGAKGRKSVGKAAQASDPINKGAQRKDVVSSGDGDKPPDDLALNYTINEDLVRQDLRSGKLPSGLNILAATVTGQLRWKDVKKYFTPRQVSHVPSARALSGGKPIPRQATTPTGFTGGLGKGSGGKGAKATQGSGETVQGGRIKKYGTTLSFWTHGSLFALCRRTYDVLFPFGRYSGDWFLIKVEHRWGDKYHMTVEMGR